MSIRINSLNLCSSYLIKSNKSKKEIEAHSSINQILKKIKKKNLTYKKDKKQQL